MTNSQENKRGVVGKQRLYQMTAAHAKRAIEVLVDAMNHGENYATKVGAAKTILAKCIPDLKSTELSGEDGKELVIRFLDYGANRNSPTKTKTSTEN